MARPISNRTRARRIAACLGELFPGTARELCALHFANPFQLLVATILSAQCTDTRVNAVAPTVFSAYPTPADLAEADPDVLETMIRSTGFFRAKTRSLIGMAAAVTDRFGGEVPDDLGALVTLPGVGRKTANVVLSVGFGKPGLPVDTHVGRLARRLWLSSETDPVKVEQDLCALLPRAEWGAMSLRLILHGRRTCLARRPRCGSCALAPWCPSAFGASGPGAPGVSERSGGGRAGAGRR